MKCLFKRPQNGLLMHQKAASTDDESNELFRDVVVRPQKSEDSINKKNGKLGALEQRKLKMGVKI